MRLYLKISNPGVAPIEAFTLLGASTTGQAGVDGTAGQFGSGSKFAIILALKRKLQPVIYAGLTKLEFYTKPVEIDDGLTKTTHDRVYYRISGKTADGRSVNRIEETSLTLNFGQHDWTELAFGLRELVTNALDRANREAAAAGRTDLSYIDDVKIEVVEETKIRAKAGETTFYIEYTDEVKQFHGELGRRFLHFGNRDDLKRTILPKSNRNLGDSRRAVIYREGILVREIQNDTTESVYDYNLSSSQLAIDECRNLNDYVVASRVASLLRDAQASELVPVLSKVLKGEASWEGSRLTYNLDNDCWDNEPTRERRRAAWSSAFLAVAGNGVICSSVATSDYVANKGRQPVVVSEPAWAKALAGHGIDTDVKVLTANNIKGIEESPATADVQAVVDDVWALACLAGMNGDRTEAPRVVCFRKLTDGGSITHGWWDPKDDYIGIREDIATGRSPFLLQVVVHETAHFISRSCDHTPDFQNFLVSFIVAIATAGGLL